MITYLRRHHIAFLALFLALGGGGAYAATQLSGGAVRGFAVTSTNSTGGASGTLAKLEGLTLTYRSESAVDSRNCRLIARTKGKGELHTHVVIQPSEGAREQFVGGKRFSGAGSADVVSASADAGAPDITRQAEGQLTWAAGTGHVATAVFHVSAETKRCAFQGTLTGAG
ncbi:MAG: hypothetical protein ACJ760_00415 [Thermoleophilaceae bacterium]